MQTLHEFYEKFEPKTDKGTKHSYIEHYYSPLFTPLRNDPILIVEIGVYKGYSLLLWEEFFTNYYRRTIWGFDNSTKERDREYIDSHMLNVDYIDGYSDSALKIFNRHQIDFVIDDASH